MNQTLASCIAGRLLSDLGTRLYFPKGIIAQSGEAKKLGHTANATIGMACKGGKPVMLSALKDQLPGLTSGEAVAYPPTAGNEDLRKLWLDAIRKKNPSIGDAKISLPVLVPGLTAGISYLSDLFLGEGDVLLTGAPAWDNYVLIVEARRNATLKGFDMFKGSGFNVDGFRRRRPGRGKDRQSPAPPQLPPEPVRIQADESRSRRNRQNSDLRSRLRRRRHGLVR